ncbi:bone morphogenetic protein receptor type-2-like [Liolophura sinensis]|uniref:bone morphogenetic protein receptor type-2-like n=1 Tax=Liolophura sinensis TaxID=3198878 RepID=UPI0031583EF7
MQLAGCFFALGVLLVSAAYEEPPVSPSPVYCAHEYNMVYAGGAGHRPDKPSAADGDILADNKTVRCRPEIRLSCYAFWKIDHSKEDGMVVIMKGCWIDSLEGDCESRLCQAQQVMNNSRFCCCSGDMCNVNVTDTNYPWGNATNPPTQTPETRYLTGSRYKMETIIIALVPLFAVGLIIVILFVAYRLWMNSRALRMPHDHWVEAPPPSRLDLSSLKLSDTIRKGRYSEVLKGTLNDREVVIKKFMPPHRQYYYNERNIYLLPFMDHESLLQFYGADERENEEGERMQYMLVLAYMPLGSLKGYLKNYTINWSTLCGMCHSVAKGLAHLHMEFKQGDKVKPPIAHRDINTANILVKNDLTCVIADFGFSMTTMGSKIFRNGHRENAEQFSLTDVGTISYMAPEVLEGAMNLRDCEASLKQVDIYALGLVLWEVSSRCTDLYQGLPVPEHMIPYQAEAGPHPSFEDIQMIVYHNKTRPKFPDVWKDSNQAIRALKETIEDCWDSDAEARLTALCVEERLAEIAVLWANDVRHKGVTPTLNTTGQDCLGDKTESPTLIMPGSPVSPVAVLSQGELSPGEPTENSSAPLLARHPPGPDIIGSVNQPRQSWFNERSVSSSTTETTILSPSEAEPPAKPHNINLAKSNLAAQQNHGRNPIVERNTHKSSDEELTVSGNTLISSKTSKVSKPERSNVRAQRPSNHLVENAFDAMTDNVESSLVQNDHLSPHRNRPIAYQQNPVHSEPVLPRPLSGNTHPSQLIITSNKTNNYEHKHKSLFAKLKPREIGLKLSHFAFGKHAKTGSQIETKTQNKRCKPAVNLTGISGPQLDPGDPRPTEVCILNGVPVVRPTSLAMTNGSVVNKDNHSRLAQNRLGIAEVGIAKLQTSNGGIPSVVRVRNDHGLSRSSSDLSPSNLSDSERWEETDLMSSRDQLNKRPSTLPLVRQDSGQSTPSASMETRWREGTCSQPSRDTSLSSSAELTPGEKIKRRVKTPVSGKRGRFSLYSDRMMFSQSCDDIGTQPAHAGPRLNKASISLHQFSAADVERHWQSSADV